MVNKRCTYCGELKPLGAFHRRPEGSGYRSWCIECERAVDRQRRASDPNAAKERDQRKREKGKESRRKCVQKRYTAFRDWLDNLKSKPCMDCGGSFPPCCMDFDHRPGETKKFIIGHALNYSPQAVLAEIAKCDLICSNCHRIRTQARRRNKVRVRYEPSSDRVSTNTNQLGLFAQAS